MQPITIVDARMGRGKTSAAIQYMNDHKQDKRFLYVTPYLNEVARICESCEFDQSAPSTGKSKSAELKHLLYQGRNVAATHALFSLMDGSTAVRSGKTVIITSPNPMLKGMLLTNNIGARLADIVERKLGSRHKLRIARNVQPKAENARPTAFQDILSRAAGEGVTIIRPQNNDRTPGDDPGI